MSAGLLAWLPVTRGEELYFHRQAAINISHTDWRSLSVRMIDYDSVGDPRRLASSSACIYIYIYIYICVCGLIGGQRIHGATVVSGESAVDD
jgi:hypothetical protein